MAAPRAIPNQQKFAAYLLLLGALVGGLVIGYYATVHLKSYARMGNAPEELSALETLDLPVNAGVRWVHLKDSLKLDCQDALQQTANGSVEFTEYTGRDQAGRTFFLQYKGDVDCQGAAARPLEGLVGESPIYWWTTNGLPAPQGKSVEIRVGYLPSAELWEGLPGAFTAALFLALFGYLAFKLLAPGVGGRPTVYRGVAIPRGL